MNIYYWTNQWFYKPLLKIKLINKCRTVKKTTNSLFYLWALQTREMSQYCEDHKNCSRHQEEGGAVHQSVATKASHRAAQLRLSCKWICRCQATDGTIDRAMFDKLCSAPPISNSMKVYLRWGLVKKSKSRTISTGSSKSKLRPMMMTYRRPKSTQWDSCRWNIQTTWTWKWTSKLSKSFCFRMMARHLGR